MQCVGTACGAWKKPPSAIPRVHVGTPQGSLNAQRGNKDTSQGQPQEDGRYLGQPGNLDEPLEVQHVRGSAEEVSEAAGAEDARSRLSQAQPGSPSSPGPSASSLPGLYLWNCSWNRSLWPCRVSAGRPEGSDVRQDFLSAPCLQLAKTQHPSFPLPPCSITF